MRFTTQALAVLAQAFLVLAADNPFSIPVGFSATAGQSLTLNWTPTTSGTVSLILRSGASSDLDAGTYIVQSIANSGSYDWSLPSDITRGSDYAVEIVDDSDDTKTNYTPYFVIDSTNTVASSTSQISLGAPTASISQSTASATGSATDSTMTGTTTGSAVSSAISSANSAISSASASVSSVAASLSSSAASHSGSASSSMATSSKAASSSASASASASSTSATPISDNGAAMATAFPGLMGVLALGALVL